MAKLLEYINEAQIICDFEQIDNNILCESLQCKVLKDIANQLLNDKGQDWYSDRQYTFRKIFPSRQRVSWSEITDDDVTFYSANDWDETGKISKKLTKSVKDVISARDNKSVIIVQDPQTNKFTYVIFQWGAMIVLSKGNYGAVGSRTGAWSSRRNWKDITNKEKLGICQNNNIYVIDVAKHFDTYLKLTDERRESKKDMVLMDPQSMAQIARDNIKRYQEILVKRKADRENNDALIDEVNDVIKQVVDLTAKVAKNPSKYADIISDLSYLNTYVYDTRRTEYSRVNRKYMTYGKAGLLPNMMQYVNALNSSSKSGSSYDLRSLNSAKEALQDSLKKCKEYLAKISESNIKE